MTTRYHNHLNAPTVAGSEKSVPNRRWLASRAGQRLDLSGPFTVALIAGFTSAGLFLSAVLRHELPLGRLPALVLTDPFGVLALALLAAAAVMARMGDV
jgi:hypothetical protein